MKPYAGLDVSVKETSICIVARIFFRQTGKAALANSAWRLTCIRRAKSPLSLLMRAAVI
jgi:hypothetical protein